MRGVRTPHRLPQGRLNHGKAEVGFRGCDHKTITGQGCMRGRFEAQ